MSEVDECRAHHEVPDGLVIKVDTEFRGSTCAVYRMTRADTSRRRPRHLGHHVLFVYVPLSCPSPQDTSRRGALVWRTRCRRQDGGTIANPR